MKKIDVPTRDKVKEASQLIFDQIKKNLGKVPNLYATIGYSPMALKALLQFDDTLKQSTLGLKEKEAIALVVSEVNDCTYCLSAHTISAVKNGFSLEETIAIRRGEVSDPKLNSVVQLAKNLAENKGKPDFDLLDRFFEEGYTEETLMEIVALLAFRTFTNYAYSATDIPIDFSLAPTLQSQRA